jgi:Helix-turn-helix domain
VLAEEVLSLSRKELDRVGLMQGLVEHRVEQAEAARQLGLSVRQVKRLLRSYRCKGPRGLVSRRRARPSNRRLPEVLKAEVLGLMRVHYSDFGPTLAQEKLTEVHGLRVSVETLRGWMIEAGLWRAKVRRRVKAFQLRERRACFGELVQIDGSPHDWFEGRAAPCTLIVFIDDATSRLLYLRFVPAETTAAYLQALREYLARYGRPVSFYSDRHSIFRVNAPEAEGELTQFGRALASLDVEAIHAHTPQAKGRVERANQTLQDRLVKELRLRGISDMEAANGFLEAFCEDYNRRFAVTPRSTHDAHRPVLHSASELVLILGWQSARTLSKNLTLQYQNILYQVQAKDRTRRLRQAEVTVCEALDGTITLLYQGERLPYTTYLKGNRSP